MENEQPECAVTICGETSRLRLWLHWRLVGLAKVIAWISRDMSADLIYASLVVLGVQYRIYSGIPRRLSAEIIKPALMAEGILTELTVR